MATPRSQASSSRWSDVSLIAGALIPLGLAVFFNLAGPTAQQVAEGAERPALAFDQYLVNLGKAPLGKQFLGAKFRFTNSSSNTVRITKLEPSCGCLNPRLEKREYEPNESGDFLVRVETPNEAPGPKEYTVIVHYTDPAPRQAELFFKVVLPEKQVVVRPRSLIFSQSGTDATTHDAYVIDYRAQPLRVTDVKSTSELVAVELGDVTRNDDGSWQQHLIITVSGDVPPGVHWPLVIITTNDEEFQHLKIPLQIRQRPQTEMSSDRTATKPDTNQTQ